MKKLVMLFVMMFAVALWFGSTASANSWEYNEPDDVASECGSQTNITAVRAKSEGGNIIVEVDIDIPDIGGDGVDYPKMVKYRLHIDHRDNDTEAKHSTSTFTPEGNCDTSSDDGLMYRYHKNSNKESFGTGTASASGSTITYIVPYDKLTNEAGGDAVVATDVVHLWIDTQDSNNPNQGICDHHPDLIDPTDCQPQEDDDVITLELN